MKMKTTKLIWRRYYWMIPATVLLISLTGSGLTEIQDPTTPTVNRAIKIEDTIRPLEEWVKQVVESIYPIENVGVIARSVTFPQVLNQGQAIINTEYPNASILCMDVANYSGLVTGLIWSMDRATVEEYRLQYLIDWAGMAFLICVDMFIAPQVANPDRVIAASAEIKEKTPAVSMEDAKKAVVVQIEKIQEVLRFAQTVKSKQSE
jgi:hypothetical protein